MDFKKFYDALIFDVDRSMLKSYQGKQGDTKSRGIYVTIAQQNVVVEELAGLSMRLFYEKPDKTRGFIDGVIDDGKFRIDYTNQMYAVPGVVKAELRLSGTDGEIISNKTFNIVVDASIADGSIVSKDERGILDRAFELAEDIIPRIELLDVVPVASSTILGGIKVGENLKIDENGVLSVDTATDVEQDNTKPVTSAAVHVQLGNVEALLSAL